MLMMVILVQAVEWMKTMRRFEVRLKQGKSCKKKNIFKIFNFMEKMEVDWGQVEDLRRDFCQPQPQRHELRDQPQPCPEQVLNSHTCDRGLSQTLPKPEGELDKRLINIDGLI